MLGLTLMFTVLVETFGAMPNLIGWAKLSAAEATLLLKSIDSELPNKNDDWIVIMGAVSVVTILAGAYHTASFSIFSFKLYCLMDLRKL